MTFLLIVLLDLLVYSIIHIDASISAIYKEKRLSKYKAWT